MCAKHYFFTGKQGLQVSYLELTSQALEDLILSVGETVLIPDFSAGIHSTPGTKILPGITGPSHREAP